jgi:hypothetical protein
VRDREESETGKRTKEKENVYTHTHTTFVQVVPNGLSEQEDGGWGTVIVRGEGKRKRKKEQKYTGGKRYEIIDIRTRWPGEMRTGPNERDG